MQRVPGTAGRAVFGSKAKVETAEREKERAEEAARLAKERPLKSSVGATLKFARESDETVGELVMTYM